MSVRTSPLSPLFQLLCFHRGLIGMTEEHYDWCFDQITGFLEAVNNERYRLTLRPGAEAKTKEY